MVIYKITNDEELLNSIKELKEQLGYEEIGLDDTFVFHCTQCGKCCIHRDDILLSPKDLFNIAKKFQITPENALEQYCENYAQRKTLPLKNYLRHLGLILIRLNFIPAINKPVRQTMQNPKSMLSLQKVIYQNMNEK